MRAAQRSSKRRPPSRNRTVGGKRLWSYPAGGSEAGGLGNLILARISSA